MAFYKRENEELIRAPNFVIGPGFELRAETHTEHTYPVDGWYWFDSLDEAMTSFSNPTGVQVVTVRQARLALLQAGLLDDIEAAIAASDDRALQIEWGFATEFRRDWPALTAMQPALGLSDTQVDALFATAAML